MQATGEHVVFQPRPAHNADLSANPEATGACGQKGHNASGDLGIRSYWSFSHLDRSLGSCSPIHSRSRQPGQKPRGCKIFMSK